MRCSRPSRAAPRRPRWGSADPPPAKTGTATNDNEDVSSSWFVGYTPQVSTAVMYVRGKGNQALNGYLPSFYGGDYPAATWTSIMSALMEGVPVEDFPPPAFVDGEAPGDRARAVHAPPPEPEPTEKTQPEKPKKQDRANKPDDSGPPNPPPDDSGPDDPARRRRQH